MIPKPVLRFFFIMLASSTHCFSRSEFDDAIFEIDKKNDEKKEADLNDF